MPEPVTPTMAAQAITYLTNLQELLHDLGLHARLLTPDERLPCLRVINPQAATMSEIISAAPRDDRWLFWWSWPEPINDVTDPATAAKRICHVLATTPAGTA
ncbi:hypothetical protein [Nonomuraea sp. NPDC049625]|uniref:hypothetical protein n=1 Tax=Nonomuraea sp. NPDC049625 TaxID=3155775 RepID=UPI003423E91E